MTTKGTLYMIPCPIADTNDVYDVLPAANRRIMDSLDYFIVENTRTARRFLSRAGIARPIDSLEFVELNEHTRSEADIERMIRPLEEGRSAGVISEAGLPGVADPGAQAALAAHRRGIRVVPLVGPSSILMALMSSGQNGQSFAFNGYLPIKEPERSRAIRSFERRAMTEGQCQIFIEAPHADDARDAVAAVYSDYRMRHNIARRIDIDAQRRGVATHLTARHGQTPDHIHIGHIICSI